jgi:hypothetical protein
MFKRLLAKAASIILMVAACSVAGNSLAQPSDPAGLRTAVYAQEKNNAALFGIDGVVGTGVSVDARGKAVIKVFLASPEIRGVPRRIDGVPVRLQVTGRITALRNPCSGPPGGRPPECSDEGDTAEEALSPTSRFPRPAPTGVSTGHPAVTAGTICCRVLQNGQVFALSNNHVYANENSALIDSDVVLQPGRFDGGSVATDGIGVLSDFQPIIFSRSAANVVDAAIAISSTQELGNKTPPDGYGMPRSTTIAAEPGMPVMKYGRTTGQTQGTVDAINVTVDVGFDAGVARFVRQIAIRGGGFSKGGDSGSLVVASGGADDRKPVGLLFAGGRGATFANPIDEVLATFSIVIDGD